jgi:hypothetical protein
LNNIQNKDDGTVFKPKDGKTIMTNNNINMIITVHELRILRSAFLEICFAVKIDNFKDMFSFSENRCNIMFDCIDRILKKYGKIGNNDDVAIRVVSFVKLKFFHSVLIFVKNELIDELATRTGFDDDDFNNLILKIKNAINYYDKKYISISL